jgi:hypothetical protein
VLEVRAGGFGRTGWKHVKNMVPLSYYFDFGDCVTT